MGGCPGVAETGGEKAGGGTSTGICPGGCATPNRSALAELIKPFKVVVVVGVFCCYCTHASSTDKSLQHFLVQLHDSRQFGGSQLSGRQDQWFNAPPCRLRMRAIELWLTGWLAKLHAETKKN